MVAFFFGVYSLQYGGPRERQTQIKANTNAKDLVGKRICFYGNRILYSLPMALTVFQNSATKGDHA